MKKIISFILILCIILTMNLTFTASAAANYGSKELYPVKISDILNASYKSSKIVRVTGVDVVFPKNYENKAYLGSYSTYTQNLAVLGRILNLSGKYDDIKPDGLIIPHYFENRPDAGSAWAKKELMILEKGGYANELYGYLASGKKSYHSGHFFGYLIGDRISNFIDFAIFPANIEAVIPVIIKMAGYNQKAISYGGWPSGYMKVAEEMGLFASTNLNRDSRGYFTRGEMITIADNYLSRPVKGSKEGILETGYSKAGYYTVYGKISNVYSNSGVFKMKQSANYVKKAYNSDVVLSINDVATTFADLKPFEGQYGTALIKSDGKTNKLCYFKPGKYAMDITPSEGKASLNSSNLGDIFKVKITTPSATQKISLLADKVEGSEWHEMTYEDLKYYKYLTSNPVSNGDGTKTWTVKFPIYDKGYRTFILKADSIETGVYENVNVKDYSGNFTSTPQQGKKTMYAPDGRTAYIDRADVAAWEKVGWYTYPVATMYALDGRTKVIEKADVKAWEKVGWYTYPCVQVYAPGGKTAVIEKSDVPAWQNVGWYTYPVATVYAPDGRSKVIAKDKVSAWVNVGWYKVPVVTLYAPDGRTAVVAKSEASAWRKVGWK